MLRDMGFLATESIPFQIEDPATFEQIIVMTTYPIEVL